jgi:uncharacterized protein
MVQFNPQRLAELCKDTGIRRLRMFGSAARGDDRPDSDVDLIADFSSSVGYFELISAEDRLSRFFGRPVDLLTEAALSPYIRDSVLAQALVVYDDGA